MKHILVLFIVLFLYCCTPKSETKNKAFLKLEIIKVEKDFEKLVSQKGIAEGFYQFADSNAVLKREKDTLIIGKNNIKKYYSNPKFKTATVIWKLDFVDISQNGDLAYTYGKYVWTFKNDITGKEQVLKGIFHTVWKKQKDGSWKYVWY